MLGLGMALLGRLAEPVDGVALILGDRVAGVVHRADHILGIGLALLGRPVVPGEGLLVVARDAAAHVIHQAQQMLGVRMAGFGERDDLFQCCRVVPRVIRAGPLREARMRQGRQAECECDRYQ